MSSWNDFSRRLARASERVPAPATDAPFDPDLFTPGEIKVMTAIAERSPSFGRGTGIADLSDDDLEALAGIAERVKASREEQAVRT